MPYYTKRKILKVIDIIIGIVLIRISYLTALHGTVVPDDHFGIALWLGMCSVVSAGTGIYFLFKSKTELI